MINIGKQNVDNETGLLVSTVCMFAQTTRTLHCSVIIVNKMANLKNDYSRHEMYCVCGACPIVLDKSKLNGLCCEHHTTRISSPGNLRVLILFCSMMKTNLVNTKSIPGKKESSK